METIGATISVCYNTFVNDVGLLTGASDISNTKLTFCGNQDLNAGVPFGSNAISGGQQFWNPTPLLPSTVYVTNNYFQLYDTASAVSLEDATSWVLGTPETLNAVITGNVFQNNYAGAPPCCAYPSSYYSVIWSIALKSVAISGNKILAGGSLGIYVRGSIGTVSGNIITGANTGLWLDDASGLHVVGNVIGNSAEFGIALTSVDACGCPSPTPSSNNYFIGNIVHGTASTGYDLYWDHATGSINNHWCGNVYKTSSPSVLPSC